jgi:inorganic pyrophosphatase
MITTKEGGTMGYGNTEMFLTEQQREVLIQTYLGQSVTVTVDRPVGFYHVTKGIHLDYTVNYGFLPGVLGGDGEEQDVYILGIAEPLEQFTGRIIGVVRRRDDNEDKFVAAPDGMRFTAAQIREKIHFVEKYFDSSIFSIYDGE